MITNRAGFDLGEHLLDVSRGRVERAETRESIANVPGRRRGLVLLDGDADLLAVLHIQQWLSQTKRRRRDAAGPAGEDAGATKSSGGPREPPDQSYSEA